ncbi:hypothetical protein SOM22_08425 [Stenotrophomonas rhizophila]|uniref:hypothetical protein n=1 Tax=Stenotrophomonas rhizophila TaxID=216778 RepID=UPI002A69F7EB|nr:hypothetical protein [Stenotrophomonas rhizophila]MDY0954599.1 hypothetical protein [Stenotrophomonas rhizophila]
MMMYSFSTLPLQFSGKRLMVEPEQWPTVRELFEDEGVLGTPKQEMHLLTRYTDSPQGTGDSGYVDSVWWFDAQDAEHALRGQQLLDSIS